MMLKMILAATVWALLVSHPEYFKKMLMINLNAASFIGSLTHKIVERDTDIQSFWKPPDLHFLFSCVVYKKKIYLISLMDLYMCLERRSASNLNFSF